MFFSNFFNFSNFNLMRPNFFLFLFLNLKARFDPEAVFDFLMIFII